MKKLFLGLLVLFFHPSYAGINVDWKLDSGGSVLRFTILSADFSGAPRDWDLECGGILSRPQCKITMSPGGFAAPVYSFDLPQKNKQKASALVAYWASNLPKIGAILDWDKWVKQNGGKSPCIVFNVGTNNTGWFADSCSGSVTEPPTIDPPKPPVSCSMSGNIDLRHGSLADSEVTGNRAESTAYVYCSGAAKVKVRALASVGSDSYTVNLRADGSLKSMLSVNGVVGNAGVTLDVPGGGWKAATFSSLLIAAGTPAPGDFSGSAVAVVDVL
ncbi:TPA: hypothetical protein ACKP06_003205 [Serratia marcescens]